MNKREFLNELREALDGQVSQAELEDSYRYYSNYIDQQLENGKSEADVFAELGSPRLIAKSIIETKGSEHVYYEEEIYEEDGATNEEAPKSFVMNSWISGLGCLIVGIVILAIVGSIFAAVMSFFGPILIVLIAIYFIVNIFKGRW